MAVSLTWELSGTVRNYCAGKIIKMYPDIPQEDHDVKEKETNEAVKHLEEKETAEALKHGAAQEETTEAEKHGAAIEDSREKKADEPSVAALMFFHGNEEWGQVLQLLTELRLERFAETLLDQGWDTLKLLGGLAEEEMKEVGMQGGHRKKLLQEQWRFRDAAEVKTGAPASPAAAPRRDVHASAQGGGEGDGDGQELAVPRRVRQDGGESDEAGEVEGESSGGSPEGGEPRQELVAGSSDGGAENCGSGDEVAECPRCAEDYRDNGDEMVEVFRGGESDQAGEVEGESPGGSCEGGEPRQELVDGRSDAGGDNCGCGDEVAGHRYAGDYRNNGDEMVEVIRVRSEY